MGYIVYLEIIELNFCGLNDKTMSNLEKKGDKEFKRLTNINLSELSFVEDDDEEETNKSLI